MKEIFKNIGVLSENRVTVLIEGETGTGKELIARAIHYNSPAREHPFRTIDCSTLVGSLLESELFGHEKGAFTGASGSKRGKFELAGKGTIFLDEIGEIPIELQSKLLRFLQEKEFERLGGEKKIKSDARVIAATNKDLRVMVEPGNFPGRPLLPAQGGGPAGPPPPGAQTGYSALGGIYPAKNQP